MSEQNAGNGELLSCPFCGGKAREHYNPDSRVDYNETYIVCDMCEAQGAYVLIGRDDDAEECRRDAAEAWNTRALSPSSAHPAQGLVKALAIIDAVNLKTTREEWERLVGAGKPMSMEVILEEVKSALSAQGKDTGSPKRLPDGCCGYTDADGECCTPTPSREG